MTASPTPFFAKPANKSDHSPDTRNMVSAAVPSEEIRRIIEDALGSASPEPWEVSAHAVARIYALIAPILAEKEREIERACADHANATIGWERERGRSEELEARALAAEAERDALKAKLEIAGVALDDAAEEIEHWGAYASSYLQEKHDWRGGIERARSASAAIRAQGE